MKFVRFWGHLRTYIRNGISAIIRMTVHSNVTNRTIGEPLKRYPSFDWCATQTSPLVRLVSHPNIRSMIYAYIKAMEIYVTIDNKAMSEPKVVNNTKRKRTPIPKPATRVCNHPECDRVIPNLQGRWKCVEHYLDQQRQHKPKIPWSDDED